MKVYIEPTLACNLNCRTCIRHAWDEQLGAMTNATFARVLEDLYRLRPATIFFGGYGEPLSHPRIVEWVGAAASTGAVVECITNGTLLDRTLGRALIKAGLARLWVSLDGARPESYADVRLGAALPTVLANLRQFRDLRRPFRPACPEIGIVFVAMRRNFADLPALLDLAAELDARHFLVSNVLPHTPEMRAEALYYRTLSNGDYAPPRRQLIMPRMNSDVVAEPALYAALCGAWDMRFAGAQPDRQRDRCPFVEADALAVRWDGAVSPCLPLLHDHAGYLHGQPHHVRAYAVGDVHTASLAGLWDTYAGFRDRVREFDFAPCTACEGCVLSENNEADCYGNEFPTCGGCLWAQGVVQCP